MMKKKSSILAVGQSIAFALTLLLFINCAEKTTGTDKSNVITIGVIGEVSADFFIATIDELYKSANLAVSEINDAGGINGKMLSLELKDSYAAGATVSSVTDYHKAGVDMILGSGWSSNTIAASTYTIPNNMVMISPSATSPSITSLNDNGLVWRTCASDANQAKAAAIYLYNVKHFSKAAVIYRADDFGIVFANIFSGVFTSLGGSVADTASFPVTDDIDFSTFDFSSRLNTILSDTPQVVFFLTFTTDGDKLLNDIAVNPVFICNPPVLFTAVGISDSSIVANVPQSVYQHIMAVDVAEDTADPNLKGFETAYINKYSANLQRRYYCAGAYDIVYLYAYAMIKAQTTTDAVAVASQLKDISGGVSTATVININEFAKADSILKAGSMIDYNGASGNISFDANGDAGAGTYVITKMEGTQETFVQNLILE